MIKNILPGIADPKTQGEMELLKETMRMVIFLENGHSVKKWLNSFTSRTMGKVRYALLDGEDAEAERILCQEGCTAVSSPAILSDKEVFAKACIDLIGTLGAAQDSLEWWATDFSSKNRFNTRMPYLLERFLRAAHAIRVEQCDWLLIVGAPWSIRYSLEILAGEEQGRISQLKDRGLLIWLVISGYLCRTTVIFFHGVKTWVKGLYARVQLGHLVNGWDREQLYYVIKSFLYDHSFSREGHYSDAFFGPLPDDLKSKKNVIILGTVLGRFRTCLQGIRSCRDFRIVPVEYFLGLRDLLSACLRLDCYKVRRISKAEFAGYEVSEIIRRELLRNFYKIQPYQYFHYRATVRFAGMFLTETLLLTCENNPWERMCIMALRRFSPATKIFGYQHTVVPQSSLNMFASREEEDLVPSVDKIITVGQTPKEIIERYRTSQRVPVEIGCALRYEYLKAQPALEKKKEGHILIVLEGIFEVYHLVNYAVKQLQDCSEWEVVFRTHPVLPLKAFRSKLRIDPANISHMRISRNISVKTDIEWADVVVYWGTTVALEALSIGRPLIHFDRGDVLSYDPLFECPHLKWTVTRQDSLSDRIREIYSMEDEEFRSQQRQARLFMERYFHPVSKACLAEFTGSGAH